MRIAFARLNSNALMPRRATLGSVGVDLPACLGPSLSVTLPPGQRELIPTGLQIQLSEGFEAQVRPRSGLALSHGITVLNSPGTIDPDYLGQIHVLLINLGSDPFTVTHGDWIAQIVVAPIMMLDPIEVAMVDPKRTERGTGGFGSTGLAESAAQ
jgi:dUTP pyrophosphatase